MKTSMDKVNELVIELGFNKLEEPTYNDAEQRYALAQMYANQGYRDYLKRSIRLTIENLQTAEDMEGLYLRKGRLEMLKELMKISKQMFDEAKKIDKSLESSKVRETVL